MVFYFLARQISEGMEPKKKWALSLSQAAEKNNNWVRKLLSWVIKMPLFNLCQYSLDYHQWRWAANGWQYPARNTTNKIIIKETQQNRLNNSNTILYLSLNPEYINTFKKEKPGNTCLRIDLQQSHVFTSQGICEKTSTEIFFTQWKKALPSIFTLNADLMSY